MGQTRLFTTWDKRNRAKTSSVCCWKAAVGGWVGGGTSGLGFPYLHQGGCPKSLCRAISSCCTLPRFKTGEFTGEARLQCPEEMGGWVGGPLGTDVQFWEGPGNTRLTQAELPQTDRSHQLPPWGNKCSCFGAFPRMEAIVDST